MSPLLAAAIVVLLEGMAIAATWPVLHKYCAEFGGGPAWIGILFGLVAAPKIILNPAWGRFSDRLGRKPALIVVTIGTLLGSVTWALAPNLWSLAFSRLFAGMFGAQAVLAYAIAADVSEAKSRAHSMALLGVAFGLAMVFGPLIGGFAGESISYASVGWFSAGLQALSLAIVFVFFRETRPRSAREQSARAQRGGLSRLSLIRGEVLLLLVVTFAVTVPMSQLTSTLGLLTELLYKFDARQTSYAFAALGFLAVLVQGGAVRPLVARIGEWATSVAGLLCLALGFGLFASHPPLVAFWIATALAAIGASLTTPCLTAMLSQRVGEHEQGGVLGLSQSATGLGRAVGFSIAGWMFGALGLTTVYAVAAALIVVAGFVLAGVSRERAAAKSE